MSRLPRVAVLATIAVLIWMLVRASNVLPAEVAVHFDMAGRADGFTSRERFFVLFALLPALVALLGFGVQALVRKTPDSLINLPNREHWLAPERRARTLAVVENALTRLAALTGVLMIVILRRTIACNLDPESGAMQGVGWIVGLYLVAVVGWTVHLSLRFRLP